MKNISLLTKFALVIIALPIIVHLFTLYVYFSSSVDIDTVGRILGGIINYVFITWLLPPLAIILSFVAALRNKKIFDRPIAGMIFGVGILITIIALSVTAAYSV